MKLACTETLYRYFISEESCFEILNDVESRIAELMQKMIIRQKAPINETNMENIIRILGTVDQFIELDTDDWDIAIASSEHCNAMHSSGTIKSSFSFNRSAASCSEASSLCYN